MITAENLPVEMKAAVDQGEATIPVMQWAPVVTPAGLDYESVTGSMNREISKAILENALKAAGGNKSEAARLLNISRYKLLREVNKMNRASG
jgi:DNA-binding NtrC family response regulator